MEKISLYEEQNERDTETVRGNCQLWIYGAHILNLYTVIELFIVVYYIFMKNFQGSRAVILVILAIIKLVFRIVAFVIVKLFMSDLNRPSCSCSPPPTLQQQPQQTLQQQQQQQPQMQPQQQTFPPVSHHNQNMTPGHPHQRNRRCV